jgi:hypothetical protein
VLYLEHRSSAEGTQPRRGEDQARCLEHDAEAWQAPLSSGWTVNVVIPGLPE